MRQCRNGHLTETNPCNICRKEEKRRYYERYPEKKHAAYERRKERYPERIAWESMMARCYRPTHKHYANYGGRDIQVCAKWRDSYEAFVSDMGPKPSSKHTIERINNNLGYEPGNCRWATRTEQNRNSRSNVLYTHAGETKCLSEWAEQTGIKANTIAMRIRRGKSFEEAIDETDEPKLL